MCDMEIVFWAVLVPAAIMLMARKGAPREGPVEDPSSLLARSSPESPPGDTHGGTHPHSWPSSPPMAVSLLPAVSAGSTAPATPQSLSEEHKSHDAQPTEKRGEDDDDETPGAAARTPETKMTTDAADAAMARGGNGSDQKQRSVRFRDEVPSGETSGRSWLVFAEDVPLLTSFKPEDNAGMSYLPCLDPDTVRDAIQHAQHQPGASAALLQVAFLVRHNRQSFHWWDATLYAELTAAMAEAERLLGRTRLWFVIFPVSEDARGAWRNPYVLRQHWLEPLAKSGAPFPDTIVVWEPRARPALPLQPPETSATDATAVTRGGDDKTDDDSFVVLGPAARPGRAKASQSSNHANSRLPDCVLM